MFHHDERPYPVAKGEAAARFKAKLEEQIHAGQGEVLGLLERVQREIPQDSIVHSTAVSVAAGFPGDGRLRLDDVRMHRHAVGQLAERVGLHQGYMSSLLDRWEEGGESWPVYLVAHNLRELLARQPQQRFLVRSVGDSGHDFAKREVRGILSDKFRRLDSRPIVDAFASACSDVGAVPVEGVGGDTRIEIKAVLPEVFDAADEIVAFGVTLSNSDFGNGALSLRLFVLRCWCTNFATLEEALREVHLGRRLADNIAFSEETYRLDTRAMVSAVRDIVRSLLGPEQVEKTLALVNKAAETKIEPSRQFFSALRTKFGLLKKELEAVEEVYRTGGVELLPPGDTLYRMSNAVSWCAKGAALPERRLELERVAGQLLVKAA